MGRGEPRVQIRSWVGGRSYGDSLSHQLEDPATGQVFADVADADESIVATAARTAIDAAPSIASAPPPVRAHWLRELADAVARDADRLARLETLSVGKPLKESK